MFKFLSEMPLTAIIVCAGIGIVALAVIYAVLKNWAQEKWLREQRKRDVENARQQEEREEKEGWIDYRGVHMFRLEKRDLIGVPEILLRPDEREELKRRAKLAAETYT